MMLPMPIEDEIRKALADAERSHTLADLADRAGLHVTGLSRFKNGHTSLNVANLEKLATVLGLVIITRKIREKA